MVKWLPPIPERLLGSIRYPFLQGRFKPEVFYGEVCLPIPKGVKDAGFVAASKIPLSWHKEPATLVRSGSTTRARLQSGSETLPPPAITEKPTEVKAAYVLSRDIYRWQRGLPVIASSAHGCDV